MSTSTALGQCFHFSNGNPRQRLAQVRRGEAAVGFPGYYLNNRPWKQSNGKWRSVGAGKPIPSLLYRVHSVCTTERDKRMPLACDVGYFEFV